MHSRVFRRARFAFSLRSLLVVTFLVAVFLGTWIGTAERQRLAVDRIVSFCRREGIQKSIEYNEAWGFASWIPKSISEGERVHYWYGVESIYLRHESDLDPELLFAFSQLTGIRKVRLASFSIDNRVLSLIEKSSIKELEFFDVRFFGGGPVRLPRTLLGIELDDCTNCQPIFESVQALKQLRSIVLDRCFITDEQLPLFFAIPNLEVLSIGYSHRCIPIITNHGIAGIERLKKLRELRICTESHGLDDTGIESIAALHRLESLSLPSNRLSSDGYEMLAGCKQLKSIELYGRPEDESALQGLKAITSLNSVGFFNWNGAVSEQVLNYLVGLPKLEMVEASDFVVSFRGMKRLYESPSFMGLSENGTAAGEFNRQMKMLMGIDKTPFLDFYLNLSDLTDLDGELGQLPRATMLRELILDKTELKSSDFEDIGKISSLVRLHIVGVNVPHDEALLHLAPLKNLEQLYAHDVSISWEGLPPLGQLSRLAISGKKLTSEGCKSIARLARLETLTIFDGKITREMMASLSSSSTLKELALIECEMEPGALSPLASCASLKSIDLDGSEIDQNAGLEALHNIRKLVLAKSSFSDDAAESISSLDNLLELELERTSITDATLAAIKNLKGLEELSISDTRCTSEGIRMLESLPKIIRVVCVGIELDESVASSSIARVLRLDKWNHKFIQGIPQDDLTFLHVNRFELTGPRIHCIERATQLENLDLEGSIASSDTLAELLIKKKSLKSLSLSGTKIGDEGLRSLQGYTKLEELDLSGTEITDQGVAVLAKLPALKKLKLDRTHITSESVRKLRTHAAEMIELSLNETSIEKDALDELSNWSNLKSLEMVNRGIQLEDCIGRLPTDHLTRLLVKDVELDRNGIDFVFHSDLSQAYLKLSGAYWTDRRLSAIKNNRFLQAIDWVDTDCNESMPEVLASLPYLQTVRFRELALRKEALLALSNCSYLRSIELERIEMEGDHLLAISSIRTLREFEVFESTIPKDLEWNSLAKLPNLEKLWLFKCEVDFETERKLRNLFGDRLHVVR